ncbi:MAG: toll/interleukin-1 receptor domain-containing protein [Chitinophagaceae bacterium]
MAYIQGYTYDIFLSYAHLDNQMLFDQTLGWIEHFYTDLNILLSRRIGKTDAIKIWWDNKKLDGSVVFNDSIEEGIKKSAILLCLTSPGHIESDYCQKELSLFYKKAQEESTGLKVGDRSRILNVLLYNIPFDQWPAPLAGTTGFPFHDASGQEDLGDTLDRKSPQYRNQLQDLRDAIIHVIKGMREIPEKKADPSTKKFSIYFGDVPDSLRRVRSRTITDLEKTDYKIIFDTPPPFEVDAHEEAVKAKLEQSDLAVHLLDQFPGREIEGVEDTWYPQKQAELGLEIAKPQLIWVPAELNISEIEEEPYKDFIQCFETGKQSSKNISYIRGAKSELTQQIIDLAEKLRSSALPAVPAASEKISVLVDTHYNDQLYALELSKCLFENQIQPFINPQEDDPRKNINILGERISQVNNLIFLYGKESRDWVMERMSAALQLIVTNNYPVVAFYIYLWPPRKDPADLSLKQRLVKLNVVNNSDSTQLDPKTFKQFLQGLKAVE